MEFKYEDGYRDRMECRYKQEMKDHWSGKKPFRSNETDWHCGYQDCEDDITQNNPMMY
jgi:hypothetical protein